MSKQTIRSLTAKGYSQKKIAKTLRIRKMKVVTYQKTHKIGKRVVSPFWQDVASIKDIERISHKEAIKSVKFSPKWYERRQKHLTGVKKARDTMRKEWYDVKTGKVDLNVMVERITEDEGLLSEAGYD